MIEIAAGKNGARVWHSNKDAALRSEERSRHPAGDP
jgi:hypothetical protein